jgi:acyl-coenzyme A thioesterase PaaI-like protein
MRLVYEAYKAVGNEGFGKVVSDAAPYFGTIDPQFVDVRPKEVVEVRIKNRREIHNHLGTVHAAAMCNAAELVGGLLAEVSLPGGRRWIPSAMSVQYLAKARTDIRVVAKGTGIDWSTVGEIVVPVDIFDTEDRKVFSAQITMNIKDKPPVS